MKIDLKEIGCEDRKLMKEDQDRGQWRILILVVLHILILHVCYSTAHLILLDFISLMITGEEP
jgi:hypothetical protein